MSEQPTSGKSAWVQLYEARRVVAVPQARTPGRPPAPIPRRKFGFTLSQGEIRELEAWQGRISALLERKISLGETVGILARLCSARYASLGTKSEFKTLGDLAEKMIE